MMKEILHLPVYCIGCVHVNVCKGGLNKREGMGFKAHPSLQKYIEEQIYEE